MPTENEELVPIVRSISVLLNIDTYQGMTDEEIESLIEYYKEQAINNYIQENEQTAIENAMQAQQTYYETGLQNAETLLQYELSKPCIYYGIDSNGQIVQQSIVPIGTVN